MTFQKSEKLLKYLKTTYAYMTTTVWGYANNECWVSGVGKMEGSSMMLHGKTSQRRGQVGHCCVHAASDQC